MVLTKVPGSKMIALNLAGKAVATQHRQLLQQMAQVDCLWMGLNANPSGGLVFPELCAEN